MNTENVTVYVLNFSEAEQGRVNLAKFDFGANVVPLESVATLPPTGAAIIYILGHAVPNGLKIGPQKILDERVLVQQLRELRSNAPTLVVLDACFSQSFQVLSGAAWPSEFGRIFSCTGYERAWHTGDPERVSLFSDAFNRAMKTCIALGSFQTFGSALNGALKALQHPAVDASAYRFFDLVYP